MELNQDVPDEHFNCQEESNTLREEHTLSTSCKTNVWVLPLTLFTPPRSDKTKTISPPHLEIDFLIDSGATLKVFNNDTWNEIKEYKLQMKASAFALSAANNSKLKSHRTVKINLYPDVTEFRKASILH